MNIGVFDSGFGGLNILKEIMAQLPDYNYVYLGDNARTPYGSRSEKTIYQYTKEAVDFLFEKKCDLVILACNTASAEALSRIQHEYLPANHPEKKVLGVIIPASEEAVTKTENKKVGVMATESTVNSETFVEEIKKLDPAVSVYQEACPLIVPIVENMNDNAEDAENTKENTKASTKDREILDIVLKKHLTPILEKGIDTLVLGCTHYGLIEDEIRQKIEEMGHDVKIINENKVVASKLADYLTRHPEIKQKLSKNKSREYYSTDLTPKFEKMGSFFLGESIKPVQIEM